MVSQRTNAAGGISSRDRLLAAAAEEFAARGFDGAKVDRIATRARLNKAMLYYHFRDKAAIYRDILAELFTSLAAAVTADRVAGTPEDRLIRFIRTVAAETADRPHFPAIWLREMAEGGRHLDGKIVAQLARILETLAAVLADGVAAGVFVPAHPLVTQMGIVAPLLLYSVSAPVRARFAHLAPVGMHPPSREDVVAHVERATRAALVVQPSGTAGRALRPRGRQATVRRKGRQTASSGRGET